MTDPTISGFELLSRLGQGGFGVVYRARDRETGGLVALKVLLRESLEQQKRFEREASLLEKLRHPSVVGYTGHGFTEEGLPYLAMEWVEGRTLQDRLREGPLSAEQTRVLAVRLLSGLSFAHARGIIHRDLKPGNVYLPGDLVAEAKLLDFGLARELNDADALSRVGVPLGTPLYMSPEQARGERVVGPESDVFSLGSVLYECLTEAAPFATANVFATFAKICLEDPAPLEDAGVPAALAALIHGMLSKAPEERLPTSEIERALRALSPTELSGSAPRPLKRRALRAHAEQDPHGLLTLDEAAAAELEAPRSGAAGSRSLTHSDEQRVLCALLLAPVSMSPELSHALRTLGEEASVRAVRLLGGAQVFLFERLATPDQQALAAGRFAKRLLQLLPDARMTLCVGRTALGNQLLLGDLFERGAAMLEQTGAGTVRLDDASAGLLDARFTLRGEPLERTLGEERTEGDAPRTLLGKVTPFVGREHQLARLDALLEECREDEVCRVLLFKAPPGFGKSRLRYEWLKRLRERAEAATLLCGRGDAANAQAPFGLLRPLLRQWIGLPEGMDAAQKRARIVEALERVMPSDRGQLVAESFAELLQVPFPDAVSPKLAAARLDPKLMADRLLTSFVEWFESVCAQSTVLCVLEDLHWADAASVRFLEVALRAVRERPVMVAAFARPQVRDTHPKLFSGITLIEAELARLPKRACERMLDGIAFDDFSPALREQLVERAEGNPFFLEELVRSLRNGQSLRQLPDTILGIIQVRLQDLGEQGRLILRAASVFGERFTDTGVAWILRSSIARDGFSSWLAELQSRELVFPEGSTSGKYAFRHALIRDAAYATFADEDRVLAHFLAAEWLEGDVAEAPAVIADHFEQGRALERARGWWCRAAHVADLGSAFAEVVRCGERALACGAQGDELERVGAAVALAQSWSGSDSEAVRWAERVRASAPKGTAAWWRATQALSVAYYRTGATQQSASLGAEMDQVGSLDSVSDQGIEALSVAACNYFIGGVMSHGSQLLARAQEHARDDSTGVALGWLACAKAQAALVRGDLARGLVLLRESFTRFDTVGALAARANQQVNISWALIELGQLEAGWQTGRDAIAMCDKLGIVHGIMHLEALVASALYGRDIPRARETVQEMEARCRASGLTTGVAVSVALWAFTCAVAGDWTCAMEWADRALALPDLPPDHGMRSLAVLARGELLRQNHDRALDLASQAFTRMQASRQDWGEAFTRLTLIQCLFASAQPQQARAELAASHAWLLARADKIDDPALRRSMLTHIPEHRELAALAERELGLETPL